MISSEPHIGGTTHNELKCYAKALDHDRDVWEVNQLPTQRPHLMDKPITFIEEDVRTVHFPHHDPLVIKTPIASKFVARILVDNESSVNLLFKDAFLTIGLTDQDLSPSGSQVHAIKVFTNHPIQQFLQKLEASRRLLKWVMELNQFDIQYVPRILIKGKALEDFMVECNEMEAKADLPNSVIPTWKVYVGGASNENGSGAGISMISLEGLRLQAALRFKLPASNNKVKYEAMLAGLKLAKVVGAHRIEVLNDS
uniref:RNase H type-1 domain-containing protein n=1 Tax=Cannabis sativa TaxID=3483 RepID=A0A803Q726_CANSA